MTDEPLRAEVRLDGLIVGEVRRLTSGAWAGRIGTSRGRLADTPVPVRPGATREEAEAAVLAAARALDTDAPPPLTLAEARYLEAIRDTGVPPVARGRGIPARERTRRRLHALELLERTRTTRDVAWSDRPVVDVRDTLTDRGRAALDAATTRRQEHAR